MIAWAVESLIAGTLLMLLVLAVRRPVARLFGAEWAYALWLLSLLRLILPPLPFAGGGILIPPDAAFIPAAGESAAFPPSLGGPGQWVPLLALWAGGAAAFMIWQLVSYRNFLAALGSGMRPAAIPSFGGIPVIESDAAAGPLAVGILDRRIVVPPLFEYRYSPAEQEQELALSHELVHHRRGDLIWNSAGLVVLALNWFNPIAYFAFRAFRADQELACDAVIARRSPDRRHDYASALIKSASRPGQIAACPLGSRQSSTLAGSLSSADQLKRRLKMMKTHRTSKIRSLSGAATLVALLVTGLGLSAPGFAQEQDSKRR